MSLRLNFYTWILILCLFEKKKKKYKINLKKKHKKYKRNGEKLKEGNLDTSHISTLASVNHSKVVVCI